MFSATLLVCVLFVHVEGPVDLVAPVAEVTVYGGSASVTRRAEFPAGGGIVVLRGLPASLDRDSVRARCAGGEVVSVEVRDRFQAELPDERVQALRERVRALQREVAGLEDEVAVSERLREHVERLLGLEAHEETSEVRSGRADTAAWEANLVYLGGKLSEAARLVRERGWLVEEKRAELADAELELGRGAGQGGVRVHDVVVDLVATGGPERTLELEYVVGNAGWQPAYDLRARKDLSAVELVIRARIHQQTGEDWRDAVLRRSTAEPRRGTRGPEPRPAWLALRDRDQDRGMSARLEAPATESVAAGSMNQDAELIAGTKLFAQASDEGLSVRTTLARKETIESRVAPTDVLVGRAELAVVPERACVPALDPTVWLRARARNTSGYVLLPGSAAVHFGSDYLGRADLGPVRLDQEFVLHLGPDPGIGVTRTKLDEESGSAGFFGGRTRKSESWRIELEDHGALALGADGAVDVIVQEVLPRSTDERIDVELLESTPMPRGDERWKKEREEQGILTWVVRVPRAGKQAIRFATQIAHPQDVEIVRR